jgi:hypothetical protein
MTLRRLVVVLALACGVCVWGFAHSGSEPPPATAAAGDADGTREEALARYRTNQSTHWRHVAVGNNSCNR